MPNSTAISAALREIVQSAKAAPYGRLYGGPPRIRTSRLPAGLPRPAADPFGAYGVRRRGLTLAKIPPIPRLRY